MRNVVTCMKPMCRESLAGAHRRPSLWAHRTLDWCKRETNKKDDVILLLQGGVMGVLKFSPILVVSILLLYQAGSLHAVPFG